MVLEQGMEKEMGNWVLGNAVSGKEDIHPRFHSYNCCCQ
jgi:hypothetical protein